MQIILISSRTLGASELLLLPSPFSRLFFFLLVVCFLAVIVVVFEVLCPPTYLLLLHRCHSSTSSLLPSGLVAGFESSFIAASTTWPNPQRMPASRGGWLGNLGRSGWGGRSGVLVPLSGISFLMWAGARRTRCSQEFSGKKKKTHIGLWECDGFDVLRLTTLKVQHRKTSKRN